MSSIQIEGIKEMMNKLKNKDALYSKGMGAGTKCEYVVGYSAEYALFVHENTEARHTIGKAKFLEEPMKMYRHVITTIIADAMRASRSLPDSLMLGGLYLQKKSQELCPVLTGFLKNSAFTKVVQL